MRLILSLVHHFLPLSHPLSPFYLFAISFLPSPLPLLLLFPSLSEPSRSSVYTRPLRTKEGETGADNDLMYGPVMSLVGGPSAFLSPPSSLPLPAIRRFLPLRNEEQITRVDRITGGGKHAKFCIREIPVRDIIRSIRAHGVPVRKGYFARE